MASLPLAEIRSEVPDIVLSDLNMPGMSGFELLFVIRRRFYTLQVIAMSGTFSGDGVPPGVVADAVYEKGGSPGTLLETVKSMAQMERSPVRHPNALARLTSASILPARYERSNLARDI